MVEFYRFKLLEAQPHCLHGVSMKKREAPYRLSLALHTGEDRAKIVQNRLQIANAFSCAEPLVFVTANQTHGSHIHIVTTHESRGWTEAENTVKNCDALVTDVRGVMLGVLTADCVPLLLYDPCRKVAAAVHAGWRGTKAKIAYKTVMTMQETFGCKPEHILAGIAPAIGKCCYEVGEEIASHFFAYTAATTQTRQDKYMLDLPYINKYQLLEAGLQESHIEMSNICTACDTEHFFSYRKEQGCSGRFMSLIGICL